MFRHTNHQHQHQNHLVNQQQPWHNLQTSSVGFRSRGNQQPNFRHEIEFDVIPIMQSVQPYQQHAIHSHQQHPNNHTHHGQNFVSTHFIHQNEQHFHHHHHHHHNQTTNGPFNIRIPPPATGPHFCAPTTNHQSQWPQASIDYHQQFHRVPIPSRQMLQHPPPIQQFPLRNQRREETIQVQQQHQQQQAAVVAASAAAAAVSTAANFHFQHPQYFVQPLPIRRRAAYAPAYHAYLLQLIGTLINANSSTYSSHNFDYLDDRDVSLDNYEALLSLAERLGEAKPKGLQKFEIDQLKTCQFIKNIKDNDDNDDEDNDAQLLCVVCMCDFEMSQTLRVLPCQHQFHIRCVDKWLKLNRTCPICRADSADGLAKLKTKK